MRFVVFGALALACRRDPAPSPSAADELTARLAEAVAAKGPGYKPRTRHLRPDGSARYTNRLILERSPYLIQHAHNPVDWYPWGDEAFAKATAERKPIFLSIGYSTCHWCHVMEEESFEDEDLARTLNRDFVAIKVDREERPDLDGIYMAAVQRITGDGGWPMTVFLLPDRRPFYAGTYFPPHDGDRGPGLDTVLARVRAAYDRDPARIAEGAAELVASLQAVAHASGEASSSAIRTAVEGLARSYDADWGGFGRAPKFPRPSAVELVLRYARRTGDDKALAMVTHTLDRIAGGGIHDHVGGGFHRYATDTRWRVPHFEKMLYDNAQLAALYVAAWQATGRAAYAEVARDTLDYLVADMRAPDGAFWAASDADAGGVEGATFVWTADEIDRVVGADGPIVRSAYDVAASGASILWRPDPLADVAARVAQPVERVQAALAAARPALRAARGKRVQPAIDKKELVAWNGLAISALARAGFALDEPRYVAAARAAATAVLAGGRVHSVTDGVPGGAAFLDDLALLEAGLLDLYEADPDARWLREAVALQAAIDADFADAKGGGYFLAGLAAATAEQLLVRDKPDSDDPIPSGNSVAAMNLLRLTELTGDERYRKQALATIRAFGHAGMPAMLGALDFALDKAKQIVIVSPGNEPTELLAKIRAAYVPNRVLVRVREGEAPPQVAALVEGKRARGGAATAYVCVGTYCEQPTADPEILAKQLAKIDGLP